jgi:hypothetical protein
MRFLQQENTRLQEENKGLQEQNRGLHHYLDALEDLYLAAQRITSEENLLDLLDQILYNAMVVLEPRWLVTAAGRRDRRVVFVVVRRYPRRACLELRRHRHRRLGPRAIAHRDNHARIGAFHHRLTSVCLSPIYLMRALITRALVGVIELQIQHNGFIEIDAACFDPSCRGYCSGGYARAQAEEIGCLRGSPTFVIDKGLWYNDKLT